MAADQSGKRKLNYFRRLRPTAAREPLFRKLKKKLKKHVIFAAFFKSLNGNTFFAACDRLLRAALLQIKEKTKDFIAFFKER